MSESSESPAGRRTLWMWIGGAVTAVVVIALIVWGVLAASGGGGDAGPTASPSATSGATPSPSGTAAPSPDTTDEPAEPADPADPDVRPTLAPVPLDESQQPSEGIEVSVVQIEEVTGESTVPGEVAGPALRVTVNVDNDSGQDLETPAVVVNLYYGDQRSPANGVLKPGGAPFPGVIPAGDSAEGVFVFSVPADQRGAIEIEVDLVVEEPVVVFRGAV